MATAEIIQNGGLVIGGSLVTQLMNWGRDWWKSRQSVKVEQPLEVAKQDKYVTRGEFNRHVEDNNRDHENLFGRLNRNDMVTSEINGKLTGIAADLTLIKQKLFKTKV